ncbi:hypothetical protein I549_4333 [Mycobacterium avium subsp. avium 2285 (R)]|nr:hypothetical protein I549_4333 [Mycobacterium avium subsp. avium 2285 (R)]
MTGHGSGSPRFGWGPFRCYREEHHSAASSDMAKNRQR